MWGGHDYNDLAIDYIQLLCNSQECTYTNFVYKSGQGTYYLPLLQRQQQL